MKKSIIACLSAVSISAVSIGAIVHNAEPVDSVVAGAVVEKPIVRSGASAPRASESVVTVAWTETTAPAETESATTTTTTTAAVAGLSRATATSAALRDFPLAESEPEAIAPSATLGEYAEMSDALQLSEAKEASLLQSAEKTEQTATTVIVASTTAVTTTVATTTATLTQTTEATLTNDVTTIMSPHFDVQDFDPYLADEYCGCSTWNAWNRPLMMTGAYDGIRFEDVPNGVDIYFDLSDNPHNYQIRLHMDLLEGCTGMPEDFHAPEGLSCYAQYCRDLPEGADASDLGDFVMIEYEDGTTTFLEFRGDRLRSETIYVDGACKDGITSSHTLMDVPPTSGWVVYDGFDVFESPVDDPRIGSAIAMQRKTAAFDWRWIDVLYAIAQLDYVRN